MKSKQDPTQSAAATPAARAWAQVLAPYRQPSSSRGIVEITITIVPLVALWVLMWATLDLGYWLVLPLAIPAAGFLVRLFLIQHDCGHGSFFRHRWANDWTGRIIGILTLTPYGFWRRTHAMHHATSGNLDRRGFGDVDTLTVAEYRARSVCGRLRYRLYRPVGMMRGGWQPWASTMATNLAICLIVGVLVWLIGIKAFLLIHLPIMLLASSAGVWLFYVQHQFEDTTWDDESEWDLHQAALHGSSHYDLPAFLRWFTANIGLHHVHHLCSRIPYYRLPYVLREHPELRAINRLSLLESFRCVRLVLWDETRRCLVPFHDRPSSQ